MAHEIPSHFRTVLNPRESPASRAERLWALHTELTTPQGLLRAALWLSSAWPHLLQLLSDPHPEVRTAAVQLLGHLGAVLAARQEPSLVGRMPSSALLDWGLAMLSPNSTLPAAHRMTADAKESALTALHVCVAAMPPPEVAPFAQPLLRLTMALLEATTTPPRLLGPLLQLLLAALPAMPLAALGQSFGDLADLLCGWALEPLVALEDRQLIGWILHALRPQWHSHPDFTASLTENMLNDVKAASTSTAAAVSAAAAAAAAATATADNNADAIAQAAACVQLIQLLCDIFSAASLRQIQLSRLSGLSGPSEPAAPDSMNSQNPAQPQLQTQLQAPASQGQTSGARMQVVQMDRLHPQPHQLQQRHGLIISQVPGGGQGQATNAALPRPRTLNAQPPLALSAILPTRPGAATVRHLIGLYPRLLTTLKDVRDSLVRLDEVMGGALNLKLEPSSGRSWATRLCSCVDVLANSIGSCVRGIDPRDLDEVWEGFEGQVLDRLVVLKLQGQDRTPVVAGASHGRPAAADASTASSSDDGFEGYGPVGAVAAVAASKAVSGYDGIESPSAGPGAAHGDAVDGRAGGDVSDVNLLKPCGTEDVARTQERGVTLHMWALRTALEWDLSLLSGFGGGQPGASTTRGAAVSSGPGPDADALLGFAMELLGEAVEQDTGAAMRLLSEVILEGQGGIMGVCGLRSSPQTSSVAIAGKLLHALLLHKHKAVAVIAQDWLLEDLRLSLAALQPRAARPSVPLELCRCPASYTSRDDGGAAVAATFDCAVLQVVCQRESLSSKSLLRMEGKLWNALHVTPSPALYPHSYPDTDPKQPAAALESAFPSADLQAGGEQEALPAQGKGPETSFTQGRGRWLQQSHPMPLSVTLALCDAWASSAIALIAAVCYPRRSSSRTTTGTADLPSKDVQMGLAMGSGKSNIELKSYTAAGTCCAAYLHAIHTLQGGTVTRYGTGNALQLRVLLALQRFLRHPAVITSGALRCEQLFRMAVEAVCIGATNWDARVRAAAVDCATMLTSNVFQPLPISNSITEANIEDKAPLAASPQPPRPEAFAPLVALAFDALVDPSADTAAAAARLAGVLSEAALLTTLRGPAACCAWVPPWQHTLAVAPARRLPRVQQVARLLELIFQTSASQGNVLLRKRTPAASGGGPGANDDGDANSRMEALQRLALSMLPAEMSEQIPPGGARSSSATVIAGGAASAAAEATAGGAEERTGAALVWVALQEGAKHIVASRLRTHLGGPTQTLGALERMLQVTYSRLSQERRDAGALGVGAASRDSAWLALEMVGALERAVAHAGEGHAGRDVLQQPVLAFFAANKKVCEEWFTRGRELLTRIASMASAHHHAAHHGLQRLRDMHSTMRQLLASLAKERGKIVAAAASGPKMDVKGVSSDAAGGPKVATNAAPTPASAGAASTDIVYQSGMPSLQRPGGKQGQRRGGAGGDTTSQQQTRAQQQQLPTVAPAAVVPGGAVSAGAGSAVTEEAASVPSAVQQLEGNLSRLALAVVDVLKLVGAALLAMDEADTLQGIHTWAIRQFEPLLQGAHLTGASTVAAATASTDADTLASSELGLGGIGLATLKRRPEGTRGARSGSRHPKDAFAWLLGLSLQAAGSYEQALVSYNAFLAPTQAASASATGAGSPGASLNPTPSRNVSLELTAAAQSFVVERVAECYAALTDWSGLQDLVGAFTSTAAADPVVAGWWPGAAASIEHRFRAVSAIDSATTPTTAVDVVAGDANSVLLGALRALEGTAAAPLTHAATPAASTAARPSFIDPLRLRPNPQDLDAIREVASLELSRLVERLRVTALSDPTSQRELLLQASCLKSALRALDSECKVPDLGPCGPWDGLLLPKILYGTPPPGAAKAASSSSLSRFSFGLGRALLTPDGGLQTAIGRDVAVVASLLRIARGGDPRLKLPGTQALSVEHIRAAAASGNWSLAIRLVQAAAARVPEPEVGFTTGGRAVLSVVHSLLSASSGRLQPAQVVELQLRGLLPLLSAQEATTELRHAVFTDLDDLACALCTLARWMLKAGAMALHHTPAAAPHGPQHHHHGHLPPHAHHRAGSADPVAHGRHPIVQSPAAGLPGIPQSHLQQNQNYLHQPQQQQGLEHAPPGFTGANAVSRSPSGAAAASQWLCAADWPALSSHLQRQLVAQHTSSAGAAKSAGPLPSAHLAFLVPETLLQSCSPPAACCLRALQLSPRLARAWKAWGDLLFRATKEHRARMARLPPAGPSPASGLTGNMSAPSTTTTTDDGTFKAAADDTSGAWAAVGYGAAAVAYCRYLTLSYSEDTSARLEDVLPVLLQLLHIVVRHAAPIEQLLEMQLAAVPPPAWSTITPQLLAQLPGASGAARRLLGQLLHTVGRTAPSLVLYPAVVEVRAADAAAAVTAITAAATAVSVDEASSTGAKPTAAAATSCVTMVPELRALLADLGRSRPRLLAGVEVLVAEMERLTVLWDERWAALLAEVEVEIARRAVSLQAEAARVADDASLTPEQREALLSSRYSTLMAPAVMLLERQLRATSATLPETPHERWFVTAVLPRLRAAAASLRDATGVRDWARPNQAWAPLRAAAAVLARQQRQPLPPITELSPRLAALQGSDVPMPGCHAEDGTGIPLALYGTLSQPSGPRFAGGAVDPGCLAVVGSTTGAMAATVTVAGVYSELVALNTKTRPKRVALLGSDGRMYTYLLKGREDLRMDERLMQVLRAINGMLQADPTAASSGLATVRCYSVTPLGPRAGLIQWVPATTSLFGVFRQWQAATLERHAAMVAARQEGVAKALVDGVPAPPEVEPPPPAAVHRPMDLFYSTLVSALQERGLSSATPRSNWPADLLRAVFSSLAMSAPAQLLARVLWVGGGSAALAWRRQQRYGRSLAVMSCVGHLLGLGDRHPDNILLEEREAGVVHIDYNVCWDKGAKLRVPEVVPFRLTQMLRIALGVGGLEGIFRAACEATLACLRRRREALVGLADAVLSDPGVDWAVEREDMAARQDMELAVALNLFVSRAEEAQRQLHQQAEEDLPALLEGPMGVLLSYVEAQIFAEAMRSAATEAQQRIQQAKSALEAASRAEAEASAIVAAAAQEAASLAAEGNALSNAVPQLLQQCGAWAQQHAGTLGILREGSFLEGTLASGASWRAVESGCALGLLAPVQAPGAAPLLVAAPLALLPAVMGGDSLAIGQLPEELLMSCQECDRQAADVLGSREAALCDAIAALTHYGTIVRRLLPPAYPASSYHHRWAQALSALAAGGLSMPAVAQAQALAPREPRPLDVATAWQALRGAQRLATAAAIVLAPGSPDAVIAMSGYVATARVSGRELTGSVAAVGKALGDMMAGVVADAHVRAQKLQAAVAVTAAGRGGGAYGLSMSHFTEGLFELLKRHIPPQDQAALGGSTGSGDGSVAAAAAALLKLVRASNSRIEALKVRARNKENVADIGADIASVLQNFLQLRGEVAGLVAVTAGLAGAQLAEPGFGVSDLGFARSHVSGGLPHSLLPYHNHLQPQQGEGPNVASRAAASGLYSASGTAAISPLPWLAAAADACLLWPELMQRLAADVAPELAGQLHVGSSGGGTCDTCGTSAAGPPDTLYMQAVSDLHVLLRPVEEALQAGRDAHARLEALTELTATYHDRRADLVYRLSGRDVATVKGDGGASPALLSSEALLTAQEHESMEADLQALDAAWASRDSVAAGLSTAAAMAADALVAALRGFYVAILGPGRLPVELQAPDVVDAAYAAVVGVEGWAEAGGSGHAMVAAVVAWWDAVTESLEGIQHCRDGEVGTVGGGSATLGPAGSVFEAPSPMRPLWRCVEVVHLVEQSLRACSQAVHLTMPAGTDGALVEAYSAGMHVLTGRATEYIAGRLVPHLRHFLGRLEAHLMSTLEQCKLPRWMGNSHGGSMATGRSLVENTELGVGVIAAVAGNSNQTADGGWVAGAPELVPFTDFDPGVAGEGELLGGLDDEDEAAGVGGGEADEGVAWLAYGDGLGDDNGVGDAASGGDEVGYDLDLGLDLDLDDGFVGASDDEDADERRGGGFDGGSRDEKSLEEGDTAFRHVSSRIPGTVQPLPPASPAEISAVLESLAASAAAAAIVAAAAGIDPTAGAAQAPTMTATVTWPASPEARAARAVRLQRLAAYEWMHEHHLLQALPTGDPRVGQALAQFFTAQAVDPLQPSARVTSASRLALLTQLQSALDALPQLEQAVSGWEAASGATVSQVITLLRSSPERYPVDTALAAQRAGVLMARRQQWLAESRAVILRVCQVAEALLQLEYSRQGIIWSSGAAAVADGFAAHCQLLGRAEVLATLAAGGSEAGRAATVAEASQRAAEAARQAGDARYAQEVAQYEEVAASSQLQAHLPQLVSRSLDIATAVAEAEPVVKGLVHLLSNKLGPALKELLSVTAQHSAASDVASMAAAVTSHFKRSHQAAEALAAALPAMLASLTAADAASPLPVDMATEVGFLSAQLLGGQAAAEETRKRAMVLMHHMAAPTAALQPVVHTVLELPRALGQLNTELSTLAAAASSIAAAVESKHLLPVLDEQPQPQVQQQGQVEAQTPPQVPSTDASGTVDDVAECASTQVRTPADVEASGTSPQDGSTGAIPSGLGPRSGVPGAGVPLVKAMSVASTTTVVGAIGQPLKRLANAAAADHLQHHRSRRSAADEARHRAFAASALRRFVAKLEGRESDGAAVWLAPGPGGVQQHHLSVPDQVDFLLRQATSADKLSQMYEGWTAWL